jgi:hypothetical protein
MESFRALEKVLRCQQWNLSRGDEEKGSPYDPKNILKEKKHQ